MASQETRFLSIELLATGVGALMYGAAVTWATSSAQEGSDLPFWPFWLFLGGAVGSTVAVLVSLRRLNRAERDAVGAVTWRIGKAPVVRFTEFVHGENTIPMPAFSVTVEPVEFKSSTQTVDGSIEFSAIVELPDAGGTLEVGPQIIEFWRLQHDSLRTLMPNPVELRGRLARMLILMDRGTEVVTDRLRPAVWPIEGCKVTLVIREDRHTGQRVVISGDDDFPVEFRWSDRAVDD